MSTGPNGSLFHPINNKIVNSIQIKKETHDNLFELLKAALSNPTITTSADAMKMAEEAHKLFLNYCRSNPIK